MDEAVEPQPHVAEGNVVLHPTPRHYYGGGVVIDVEGEVTGGTGKEELEEGVEELVVFRDVVEVGDVP